MKSRKNRTDMEKALQGAGTPHKANTDETAQGSVNVSRDILGHEQPRGTADFHLLHHKSVTPCKNRARYFKKGLRWYEENPRAVAFIVGKGIKAKQEGRTYLGASWFSDLFARFDVVGENGEYVHLDKNLRAVVERLLVRDWPDVFGDAVHFTTPDPYAEFFKEAHEYGN